MDVDFSSFLPLGWSEVDMDCSFGCTPLSIDDWISFSEEARKDFPGNWFNFKEFEKEDLCQE